MKALSTLLYETLTNLDGSVKERKMILPKTLAKFVYMEDGTSVYDAVLAVQSKNPYSEFASEDEYQAAYSAGNIAKGEICIVAFPDAVDPDVSVS